MDEYIKREEAIKMMRGSAIAKYPLSFSTGIMAAADELQKMPAADVAPVVHGRWIKVFDDSAGWVDICNKCKEFGDGTPYCPNCGEKMDFEVMDNGQK